MTRVFGYADVGKRIVNEGWGRQSASANELIERCNDHQLVVCLMAGVLRELQELRAVISDMPKRIEQARLKERKALEREKQRTAKAQREAAEAMPPVVKVIKATREQIGRAYGNGRVLRRF